MAIQPVHQHWTLRGPTRAVSLNLLLLPTGIHVSVDSTDHATQDVTIAIDETDESRVILTTHLTGDPAHLTMWRLRLEGD